jgi:hypothetical protein
MGCALNSDKAVRIFVTLGKRVYYAGEMVEGAVHLNCLEERPYRSVSIIIRGKERVMWSEQYGQTTVVYTNKRETYDCWMELVSFSKGILPGHYTYPFSFLLPANLPSTLREGGFNYIGMQLIACLAGIDGSSTDQQFKRPLHIR